MRKDATITVRVPRPTRRRLEALAKREGRSLSRQVERMIDAGLDREACRAEAAGLATGGSLAGLLVRDRAPDHEEFRTVRTLLSASLLASGEGDGARRRC